jgi:hypothetical protein
LSKRALYVNAVLLAIPLAASGCPQPKSLDNSPIKPFQSSLWIGAPDSANTTVVYTFSNPIECRELQSIAWDARIADQTQVLEMKMFGKGTGPFKVTDTVTPAPGEASVNRILSRVSAVPIESVATVGTVTLQDIVAGTSAKGSFSYEINGMNLAGEFKSTFCPGGREP